MSYYQFERHALIDDNIITDTQKFPDARPRNYPASITHAETQLSRETVLHDVFNRYGWLPSENCTIALAPIGSLLDEEDEICPILGPLEWPDVSKIPLHRGKHGYHVTWRLVRQWRALEVNLSNIERALKRKFRLPYQEYYRPFYSRYEKSHPTESEALLAAEKALAAFRGMMGGLSAGYAMVLVEEDRENKLGRDTNWREELRKVARVHAQVVVDLERSIIGRNAGLRRGGLVNMLKFRPMQVLPLICSISPIFLVWGSCKEKPKAPPSWGDAMVASLIPSDTTLVLLHNKEEMCLAHPRPPTPPSTSIPTPSSPSAQSATAIFDLSSGLARAKTKIKEFFDKRRVHREKVIGKESPGHRQAREQRAANAARNVAPGRKGATVFVWREQEDGSYQREPGGRPYDSLWEDDHYHGKRRYDDVQNEWDLCSIFSDEGCMPEHHDPYEDDDDYGLDDFDMPTLHNSLDQETAKTVAETLFAGHLSQPDRLATAPTFVDHDATPATVAYRRYGLLELPRGPIASPANENFFRKLLGNGCWRIPLWGGDEWNHLSHFFLNLNTPLISEFRVDFKDPNSSISNHYLWPFRVWFAGGVSYLRHRDHPELYIGIPNPMSVLEVIRRNWGPTVVDVAVQLAERGIPFRMCLAGPNLQLKAPPKPKPYGLGYRWTGYEPDKVDHQAYEGQRDAFLHGTRGQLALRHGGLITRIAQDVIDLDRSQLVPPPSVIRPDGYKVDIGSATIWYDKLSEDEIQLLCGEYHVYTAQASSFARSEQTANLSWWPAPHLFDKCGLSIGWWSPDCERWYHRQLDTIQCKTSSKWRKALSLERKMAARIEQDRAWASVFMS